MTNTKKTLLLWDRMGDYHRARWTAFQKLAGKENVFAADLGVGDTLYKWESTRGNDQYALLSHKKVNKKAALKRLINFVKLIRKNNIEQVCIAGYGRLSYILILIFSKLLGRKTLIFAESWYPGNPVLDKLKGLFVKMFCDFVFTSGKKASDFFINRFGIPAQRIIEGYSVIDNKHFESAPTHSINQEAAPILLCTARFAPEKNLENLIEAFYKSDLHSKKWHLKLVGGGTLKEKLRSQIKDKSVHLSDWLSYKKLPALYHNASCFILPSIFEPWGLVVNEAMAAKLPVIASLQCGCEPDLINNDCGWSFDAEDNEKLIKTLNKLAQTEPEQLKEMGRKSLVRIQNYSPETWASKIIEAFNKP